MNIDVPVPSTLFCTKRIRFTCEALSIVGFGGEGDFFLLLVDCRVLFDWSKFADDESTDVDAVVRVLRFRLVLFCAEAGTVSLQLTNAIKESGQIRKAT